MQDETMIPSGWTPMKIGGFADLAGPLLKESPRGPGDRRYALLTDARHRNGIGLVHGGVLTTLIDQVIALVAWHAADRRPTVTLQLDTRFAGAARAGDLLEATARIRHRTRTMLFVDGEITVGDTPVAYATAVMKITTNPEQAR